MFVPHEIIIIGAMLYYKKHDISYTEVNQYIKRRGFKIELDESFNEFTFIKLTKEGFHIDNIPNMNPVMIQFLMQ